MAPLDIILFESSYSFVIVLILEFPIIQINNKFIVANIPTFTCNFDHLRLTSSPMPADLAGVCQPSAAFPNVQVQAIEGLPKQAIKGTLGTSSNSLVLRSFATSPESLCLRDLEMCPFGLTISFWMFTLPTTKPYEIWPILSQNGPSGSQLKVDLIRTGYQYRLESSVKSLHMISAGKANSRLWKANVRWLCVP